SARDRNGEGTLHVATSWSGLMAEGRRELIPSQTPEQAARNSLAYYRQDEPAVEALKAPSFSDEPEANRFRTDEWLRIPRCWATGEHTFEPEVVRMEIPHDAESRTQPLRLRYPWHAKQRTRIELPDRAWDLPDDVHRFESAGFRAEVVEHLAREPSGPVYLVTTDVRTIADFIPAAEVPRHAQSIRDLRKAARINLTFHGRSRPAAASPVAVWKELGFLVAFFAVLGASLFGIARGAEKFRTWRARSFLRKTQSLPGESASTPLEASDL